MRGEYPMSSSIVTQAADRRGPMHRHAAPAQTRVVVVAGSGSSQNIDLSSNSYFNSLRYLEGYVSMSCEAAGAPIAFFWYWSDSASDTIDKTATGNGATVGGFCPSGIVNDERPTGQYLVIQTASAANVHVWESSGKY